jgi:hypothetical protein
LIDNQYSIKLLADVAKAASAFFTFKTRYMERLLFTTIMLGLSIRANAQFEKGDTFIAGTASLYFQSLSTSQN